MIEVSNSGNIVWEHYVLNVGIAGFQIHRAHQYSLDYLDVIIDGGGTRTTPTCYWPDNGFGSGEVNPGESCLDSDGSLIGQHGATCGCDGVCYDEDSEYPLPADMLQAINAGFMNGELRMLGLTISDTTNDRMIGNVGGDMSAVPPPVQKQKPKPQQ